MTDQLANGSGERVEVAVIGAGQAGLAMGYFLAKEGRTFAILEAAGSIGAAWRTRWDSLVLFTPRRYDSLPGLPFPGDPNGYPTREEVVSYLEQYTSTFELPVRLNSSVLSLAPADGGFVLDLGTRTVKASQVVVATGPFQVPNVPAFAADLGPDIVQMHSTGYRRPSDLPEGTVVVVGGGNTGFQIAKELSATHSVLLAIGSRQTPLPQRVLGRDLFWWLTKTGLIKKTVESRIGRRARDRDTLIGSSTRDVKRHGVEVKPRVVGVSGDAVKFEDGSELSVDAVIWATGYRSEYGWIDIPVFDQDGRVLHRRGVTDFPGLFFLGMTWQHTRGSALLGWVKDDAEFISERIAANADDRTTLHGVEAEAALSASRSVTSMNERPQETVERQHGDFPTDTSGLPRAARPSVIELADGDTTELHIGPVVKRIGDTDVRMLAYNGSIPGPTFKAPEGATVTVHVTNEGDLEATVHWHGLRLENRYDGTHDTQAPIPIGETFTYEVHVPDPGVYWYHPHIREDYGQEMGLYGNIQVVPAEPDYWPPVNRELFLTLDDVLIEDGKIAGFSSSETTHVAMGRFGNVMLVSGEPDLELTAKRGEIVRFYLTNTANTRVFNVTLPGARMKLVGGDSGHYERESIVEDVLLSPSERAVVDVLFEHPGEHVLEHRTPARSYRLASISVNDEPATPALAEHFAALRTSDDMAAERKRTARLLDAAPDKTLSFVAEMDFEVPEGAVYTCPMHPDIVSDEPGRCPECGMKLLPVESPPTSYVCPMHPHVMSDSPDRCPECGMKLVPAHLVDASEHAGHDMHASQQEHHDDGSHSTHESDGPAEDHGHEHAQGIEWEDDMVEVNRRTTAANMRWKLVDGDTGAANAAIDWKFRVGDEVKIRLVNEMDSDHPMPHPFHVHGAGRFLVLARDGVEEPNLVWKDTVLVRTGETVDILLDVTNPGRWMAHCHIAEHHESGMMFGFDVEP